MKHLGLIIVGFLLSGCESYNDVSIPDSASQAICQQNNCVEPKASFTILVDNRFTPDQQDAIFHGSEEWSVCAGNIFDLSYKIVDQSYLFESYKENTISVYYDIGDISKPSEGGLPANVFGMTVWYGTSTSLNSAYMHIRSNIEPGLFLTVARHEFGHAYHLQHSALTVQSIMHPTSFAGEDITCEDMIAFCNIWGCEIDWQHILLRQCTRQI